MKRPWILTGFIGIVVLMPALHGIGELVGHWSFDDHSSVTSLLADTSSAGTNNGGTFIGGAMPAGITGVLDGAIEMFGNQNINVGSSDDFETHCPGTA